MIHQLMLHSDLLGKLMETPGGTPVALRCAWIVYKTIYGFVEKLTRSWETHVMSSIDTLYAKADIIQIRFVYNTS